MLNLNDFKHAFLGKSLFNNAYDKHLPISAYGNIMFMIDENKLYSSKMISEDKRHNFDFLSTKINNYYYYEKNNLIYKDD